VTATGEIVGADIEINTSSQHPIVSTVDGSVPSGAYNVQSILLHEAGHFLGLAHSQDTSAVMYAYYPAVSTTLTDDDVNGICALYPTDTSRETADGSVAATGCHPEPALGFESVCGTLDASVYGASVYGSGPVFAQDVTQPESCPRNFFSCATAPVGHIDGAIGATWCLALGAFAGWIVRRHRVRANRLLCAIAVGSAFLVAGRNARAAVSVASLFDDVVARSVAVAVVTSVEARSVWEGKRIVTYTHVRVERLVAGQLPSEVWLQSLGGNVDSIRQVVEGQPTFALGEASLVFLRTAIQTVNSGPSSAFAVVDAAQGQFPLAAAEGIPARLRAANRIGAVLAPHEPAGRTLREVLEGIEVGDAARAVAAAWAHEHGR
jgi:hypothetical protein